MTGKNSHNGGRRVDLEFWGGGRGGGVRGKIIVFVALVDNRSLGRGSVFEAYD